MKKMPRSVLVIALASLLPLVMATSTYGSDDEMKAELKQARAEIEQLRAEMAELKNSSNWKYQQDLRTTLKDIPAGEGAAAPAPGTLILPAGWTIKPYGYIKADMIYNDSKTYGGDELCFWVPSENDTTRSDDGLTFTARQTRLGMIITAPDIGDMKVRGLVETDFYGNGYFSSGSDRLNVGPLRMRRAFGEISGKNWLFLFGQDAEIVGPLAQDVLDFTYGACHGGIGFRHPQMRYEYWWDFADKGKFKTQTAVMRMVSLAQKIGSYDNNIDSGLPFIEQRLSYSRPSWVEGKRMEIGFAGGIGKEEVDLAYAGQDTDVRSWILAADLAVPVVKGLEFQSELWYGENVDCHDGGIYQGIANNNTREGHLAPYAVEAVGGWGQFSYMPCDNWKFNAGVGVDDPRNGDVLDSGRNQNTYYYTNGRYFFSKYLWTGLELGYYFTQYQNAAGGVNVPNGDNFRIQHSWQLSF